MKRLLSLNLLGLLMLPVTLSAMDAEQKISAASAQQLQDQAVSSDDELDNVAYYVVGYSKAQHKEHHRPGLLKVILNIVADYAASKKAVEAEYTVKSILCNGDHSLINSVRVDKATIVSMWNTATRMFHPVASGQTWDGIDRSELIKRAQKARDAGLQGASMRRVLDAPLGQVEAVIAQEQASYGQS